MGVEIERKFLVKEGWQPTGESVSIKQGYLPGTGPMLVRIRLEDQRALLTLKGRTEGVTRRASSTLRVPSMLVSKVSAGSA